MKKQIVRVIAVLASCVLCSCAVEDSDIVTLKEKSSLTIAIGEGRTSLGESINGVRKIYWSSGDIIAANGVYSSEVQIDGDNASIGVFEFSEKVDGPCSILYPACYYKDPSTITVPRIQSLTTETFATNTLPMATYVNSIEDKMKMHHLMGVVHLQLTLADGVKGNIIRKIEITDNDQGQMSGDFAIDYTSSKLTSLSTNEIDRVIGASGSVELSQDNIINLYVVVPAREYANGFTVRVINSRNSYMDKVKSSGITISEGEVLKMPTFEFKPTGMIFSVEV